MRSKLILKYNKSTIKKIGKYGLTSFVDGDNLVIYFLYDESVDKMMKDLNLMDNYNQTFHNGLMNGFEVNERKIIELERAYYLKKLIK